MISSFVNNPTVQTLTMEAMKQFINKVGKTEKKNIRKEDIEEIKQKIKEEFRKNESFLSQALKDKDNELEKARSKNNDLLYRVRSLKTELSCQQKEESVSMQLLKDKEDMAGKIEELERELKKFQALKDIKEWEAEKAKREFLEQKKSNEEQIQTFLTILMELNLDANKESDLDKTKEEILGKFDDLEKTSLPSKKANKPKKNKKASKNEKSQELKEPEPKNVANPNNMPGPSDMPNYPMHNPANTNYHNIPGPSNIPYHNTPGPSNMHQNMPNFNMPQNMPNFNMPQTMPNFNTSQNMTHFNMPQNSPYMPGPGNYNNRPDYNYTANMMHSSHSSMPQCNRNYIGSPLQMGMPLPDMSAPPPDMSARPPYLNPNLSKPNQFNITQKPNNLEQNNRKQNKEKKLTELSKNKDDKKPSEETKETVSTDKSKSKSVSTFDLWDELDKLKEDIKNRGAVKSELMTKIPNMMAQASSSTIPSKEKYMVELSECLEQINKLPESSSSNQTRRNFKNDNRNFNYRGQGWRGGYRNFRGQGIRGRRCSGQGDKGEKNDNNQNSDENNCSDDDNLSLCSEPPYQRSRGGQQYRGRRYTGPGFQRENKQFNQKAVDKDNSDDASSVCSENQNNTRDCSQNYRGGQNYRGRRSTGQGNNRDNKQFNQNFRGRGQIYSRGGRGQHHDNFGQHNNTNLINTQSLSKSTSNIHSLMTTPVPAVRTSVQDKREDQRTVRVKKEDPTKTVQSKDKSTSQGPVACANQDIFDMLIENNIPNLLDAIANKWDLSMKVQNVTMVAVVRGEVLNEKPHTLLDIIQFKDTHADAVCVPNENFCCQSITSQ